MPQWKSTRFKDSAFVVCTGRFFGINSNTQYKHNFIENNYYCFSNNCFLVLYSNLIVFLDADTKIAFFFRTLQFCMNKLITSWYYCFQFKNSYGNISFTRKKIDLKK